jgi:hypothetical protein
VDDLHGVVVGFGEGVGEGAPLGDAGPPIIAHRTGVEGDNGGSAPNGTRGTFT